MEGSAVVNSSSDVKLLGRERSTPTTFTMLERSVVLAAAVGAASAFAPVGSVSACAWK